MITKPVTLLGILLALFALGYAAVFLFFSHKMTAPPRAPLQGSPAFASCIRTGCNKEICSDNSVESDCTVVSHYVCYDKAVCERQASGECGWTTTKEYDQCIEADYPHSFILNPNAPEQADKIVVTNIAPNAVVPSLLKIEGKARGTWFFEASFPVRLVDVTGRLLVQHYAQAVGEWMTTEFVPFRTELVFDPPTTTDRGYIILEKDNPSGMPKFADALIFPVRFR